MQMDTDSDGQISVAELIAWVKKNSEQVGLCAVTFRRENLALWFEGNEQNTRLTAWAFLKL